MNERIVRLIMTGATCGLILFAHAAFADNPAIHRQQAKSPPPIAPSTERKTATYGDITITGQQQMKVSADYSVHLIGPNTTVTVPDKKSGSRLVLHADDIKLVDPTKPDKTRLEMNGHLRYSVVQASIQGERRLTGTAGRGEFRRETHKIVLTDGMQCELIDPRLDGPGTLRAGTTTVDIGSSPYLFNLAGNSATNEISFTPHPRSANRSPESQVGHVHLTRWDTAIFQAGRTAQFDGNLVVADLKSRAEKPQGQLKARHVEVDFEASGEIVRAHANDDVHYTFERSVSRKTADGKTEEGRQEVTGTSHEAVFEPDPGRFTLDGDIDATLVNTLSLVAPARLLASRLVVTEPAPGQERKEMRFELTGSPNHRRLAFTPRPAETNSARQDASKVAPPAFTLGTIVVTGFRTAVLDPGKSIDVVSDGKQSLLVDTSDPKTNSASHLETHHFIAHLADTGGITGAETGGAVTFHIQQPSRARELKSSGGPPQGPTARTQSLDGNAAKAVYSVNAQSRSIVLHGPFNMKVIDPEHLVGPGSAKGQENDTASLDLVTHDILFETPTGTGVVEFTPRPLESEPDKSAPVPPTGQRKK